MTGADRSADAVTVYNARAAWDEGTLGDPLRTQITKAVLRGESISLDWPEVYGATASTILTRTQGARFKGHSVWAAGTRQEERADVEAVLYSNDRGHVLMAEETWDSGKADWFIVQFYDGQSVS